MKPTLLVLAAATIAGAAAVWLAHRRNSRRLKAAHATGRTQS